jgi:hypothetical protein
MTRLCHRCQPPLWSASARRCSAVAITALATSRLRQLAVARAVACASSNLSSAALLSSCMKWQAARRGFASRTTRGELSALRLPLLPPRHLAGQRRACRRRPRPPAVALAPAAAGWRWWWRTASAAREHGVRREVAARHFFSTGGVSQQLWGRRAFIAGCGRENEGEARSGGRGVAWNYGDTCSDATARCVAARLPPVLRRCKAAAGAAPLLSAGDEVETMKRWCSRW